MYLPLVLDVKTYSKNQLNTGQKTVEEAYKKMEGYGEMIPNNDYPEPEVMNDTTPDLNTGKYTVMLKILHTFVIYEVK